VEKYEVGLPDGFIANAAKNGWKPPQLSRERLMEIEESLFL
jgi:hypothetical protein